MTPWTEPDPGRGEADAIAGLAHDLGDIVRAAAEAQNELGRLGEQATDAIWRGTSADAFRSRIARLPGHLGRLVRSYQDEADGFTTYAAAVREIGDDAERALAEVADAQAGVVSSAHHQAEYVHRRRRPVRPGPGHPSQQQ